MKKIVAGLFAAAVVASAAYAVTSQNAVGFVDIPIQPDELIFVSVPFLNMANEDGSWDFKDVDFAKTAPRSAQAYFWDNGDWTTMTAGRSGFAQSRLLKPGESFFLKWPKSAEAADIVISGEVPADGTIPVVIMGQKNLTAVANPYPTEMLFKDSAVATNAQRGAQAFFWKDGDWNTVTATRSGFANVTNVLAVGEGFFFKTTSDDDSKEWQVERPYTWPAE